MVKDGSSRLFSSLLNNLFLSGFFGALTEITVPLAGLIRHYRQKRVRGCVRACVCVSLVLA